MTKRSKTPDTIGLAQAPADGYMGLKPDHKHRFTVPVEWMTKGKFRGRWSRPKQVTSVTKLRCETCPIILDMATGREL